MDQLKLSATHQSFPCLVMMLQCPIPAFQLGSQPASFLEPHNQNSSPLQPCTDDSDVIASLARNHPRATGTYAQATLHRDHMVSLPPLAIKSHKELIGTGWLQGEWDGERVGHWEKGEESKEKEKEEKWRDKGYGLVKLRGKIFYFHEKKRGNSLEESHHQFPVSLLLLCNSLLAVQGVFVIL